MSKGKLTGKCVVCGRRASEGRRIYDQGKTQTIHADCFIEQAAAGDPRWPQAAAGHASVETDLLRLCP